AHQELNSETICPARRPLDGGDVPRRAGPAARASGGHLQQSGSGDLRVGRRSAGRATALPRSREVPGHRVRHASCAEVSRAHERDTMKVSSLEAASAASATVSRHALVVESDLDQRRRVVAQLSHWGYTPHAVASGEEALDALGETRFAL